MRLHKTLATAAALACCSTMASAATFSLTNLSGNNTPSINVLSDDLSISLTATAPGENVGAESRGLGVRSSCCDLAGIQNNEELLITFDQAVDIGTLYLKGWEAADHLTLTYNGGTIDIDADLDVWNSNEFIAINLTGVEWFSLTGESFGTDAYLAGLEDVEAVATVPVPAAAWLFASGLAMLGVSRRKTVR